MKKEIKGFKIKTLTQIRWENYQGIFELKKLAYKFGKLKPQNFHYYLEKAKEMGRGNQEQ